MTTTTPLRDPRTFRVLPHPDRPGATGGLHLVKDDQLLADIRRGVVPGEIADKDLESYYPGDLIKGRMPAHVVGIYLSRGVIEVVEPKVKPAAAEKGGD